MSLTGKYFNIHRKNHHHNRGKKQHDTVFQPSGKKHKVNFSEIHFPESQPCCKQFLFIIVISPVH